MISSIYKIINLVNDKVYVGQTWQTIHIRFSKHKSPSEKGCIKLHNAFNKYGRDNFKIELITFCSTQKIADELEVYFINKYDSIKNGYNIREGGSRGKWSEESKKKLSQARKGKPHPHKGRIISEKNRLELSERNKNNTYHLGKTHSDEAKKKMSISGQGKHSDKRNRS